MNMNVYIYIYYIHPIHNIHLQTFILNCLFIEYICFILYCLHICKCSQWNDLHWEFPGVPQKGKRQLNVGSGIEFTTLSNVLF